MPPRFSRHNVGRLKRNVSEQGRSYHVTLAWVREVKRRHPIAHNISYAIKHDLQQVDLKTAAEVLALAATESLAYGRRGPRELYLKLAAAALGEFGTDAVFLTNTRGWESNGSMSWSANLTTATFEAGLIAYDRENAMIFWVEEED